MGKKGKTSTFIVVLIVIFLIALIVFIGFFIFYKMNNNNHTSSSGSGSKLENPMNAIVLENTKYGTVNQTAVLEKGVLNFNESYINYLFSALGTSYLHKSTLGYGNPKIEMVMGDETWNSELGNVLKIQKSPSDDPDIRVKMSKEEAVRALLSSNIKQYMKDDVSNGKIQIEMIAGKIELYSKGYLDMYKGLTGKDPDV